jgi:hypothetical protein
VPLILRIIRPEKLPAGGFHQERVADVAVEVCLTAPTTDGREPTPAIADVGITSATNKTMAVLHITVMKARLLGAIAPFRIRESIFVNVLHQFARRPNLGTTRFAARTPYRLSIP